MSSDPTMNPYQIQSGRIGGDTMRNRNRQFKLPGVLLQELGPDRHRLRVKALKDQRTILSCSWEDAVKEAVRIHTEVAGRNRPGGPAANLTPRQAFTEALSQTRANRDTLGRYLLEANRFLDWLNTAYPDLQLWADLKTSVFRAYLLELENRGLAWDSIRLALVPVKKTAAFWACEHPALFPDVTRAVKQKSRPRPSVVILEPPGVRALLAWLRANDPHLLPIAALAGFAGLRLREAAGLEATDLDLAAGVVNIRPNGLRKLKNDTYSPRIIPLCREAIEALVHYTATAKIQPATGDSPLFLSQYGEPWTEYRLGERCRKTLRRARKALALPEGFMIRRLRASFATAAEAAGCSERHLQAYMGQSPSNVLQRHYTRKTLEDFRREIVAPLDAIGQLAGHSDLRTAED